MSQEVFEIFLTSEQSKYINEQLPNGFCLQFSSTHTRRIKLQQLYSKKNKQQEKEYEKQQEKMSKSSQVLQQVLNSEHFQKGVGSASEDMTSCHYILQQLKKSDQSEPFLQRVDAQALQCPDYYKIIQDPMDLSKIECNLKQGVYQTRKQFADDVQKIWRNSFTYNKQGSEIYKMTEEMSKLFDKLYTSLTISQPKPCTPYDNLPQDSIDTKKIPASIQNKGEKQKKQSKSQKDEIPLSMDAKNWVYQNAGKLSQSDSFILCQMIKDCCLVTNDSIHLNMETLPIKKSWEVFDFISSKLPQFQPPPPCTDLEQPEEMKNKKRKIVSVTRMDVALTVYEKRQLGLNIRQLPPEDLYGIWNIILEGQPSDDVLEFDIDTLPVRKARELEVYVKERTLIQAKKQNLQQQAKLQKQQNPQPISTPTNYEPISAAISSPSLLESGQSTVSQTAPLPSNSYQSSQPIKKQDPIVPSSISSSSSSAVAPSSYPSSQNQINPQVQPIYGSVNQQSTQNPIISSQIPRSTNPYISRPQNYQTPIAQPYYSSLQQQMMSNYSSRAVGYGVQKTNQMVHSTYHPQYQSLNSSRSYTPIQNNYNIDSKNINGMKGTPQSQQGSYFNPQHLTPQFNNGANVGVGAVQSQIRKTLPSSQNSDANSQDHLSGTM